METQSNPQAPQSRRRRTHPFSEEILGEVRDMAMTLFEGRLSPALFERAIATIQAATVRRFGFRLTTQRLACGASRFVLSEAATGQDWGTLDFVSSAKGFREQHLGG